MSYFSENEIAAAMTVKLDDVLLEKTVAVWNLWLASS